MQCNARYKAVESSASFTIAIQCTLATDARIRVIKKENASTKIHLLMEPETFILWVQLLADLIIRFCLVNINGNPK